MSDDKAHPVANLFPMMEGDDFEALVDDIRANGQREAIVIFDGLILDGRNRARACRQLGIKPRVTEWNRDGSAQAFVVSANLHRRHLSTVQRAMIAEQLAKLENGQRLQPFSTGKAASLTLDDAAKIMHVGLSSVTRMRNILRGGTAKEIADVTAGRVGMLPIERRIRERTPAKKRTAMVKRKSPTLAATGRNPERIEKMRVNAELWAKLSAGLDGLTSLPLPADVAEIVGSHPKRRLIVAKKLSRAVQWIREFENEWKRLTENAA